MAVRMPVEAVAREVQALEPREKEKLESLRLKVEDILYPDGNKDGPAVYDDIALLRFLRARNFKSTKAEAMLRKAQKIWEDNDYDTELRMYTPSEAFLKYWPRGRFGIDRDGNPVFHEPFGSVDPKTLFRGMHRDELIINEIVLGMAALRICAKLSQIQKKPITKVTIIFDLEGLSMKHFYRPFVSAYMDLCELFETLFPECLSKLICLNAPRIFPMAFAIIKPLLNETTRGKFIFGTCDKDENCKLLKEHIDERWIPVRYRGPVADEKAGLIFGAPLPDELAINVKKMMANSTTLTLSRGEKHVVELGKAEEGQVLRYSIFAEGSTDVIVHFDVDGVESTQRTLKCDCTLLPKVGSFLIRRAGRLHFTIENDNLIRSKVVQYKTELRALPAKSEFLESVVQEWERLHLSEPESPAQLRPKPSKEPQPGQEERPRSYIDAANEAHVQNVNYNGLVSSLLKTSDPMQLTAV